MGGINCKACMKKKRKPIAPVTTKHQEFKGSVRKSFHHCNDQSSLNESPVKFNNLGFSERAIKVAKIGIRPPPVNVGNSRNDNNPVGKQPKKQHPAVISLHGEDLT